MRPPFYFCISPDAWLIQERIRSLVEAAGCGKWTRLFFWGDEALGHSFWAALTMPGLLSVLGSGRILVLRRAHLLPVKTLGDMEPLLRVAKPDLWVFLCLEGEWKSTAPAVPATVSKQPYFKAAKERGWLWQSPGVTEKNLKELILKWAGERGIAFAPGVLETLAGMLPLDGAGLRCELEKLDLLLGDRRLVAGQDLGLLGDQALMNNFAFLRSVLDGSADLATWRTVLAEQAASGTGLLMPFLGLLQRELRIMWQLLAGEDGNVALHPGAKQEKKRFAARLGEDGLTAMLDMVFRAELDLKTGRKDAEQILESLVATLSRR